MNASGSLFSTDSGEKDPVYGNVSDFLGPDSTSEQYIFDSPAIRSFFYVVYTVVFAFCVFGNLIVLVVNALQWRMRSNTKFFMGNLALTNFLVGIFCVYQNLLTFVTENWAFGRLMCKMYYFTSSLSHTSSILILVVMSVERYVVIMYPFRGRRALTIGRLRLTLAAVWLASAAISSPRLYYITTFEVPHVSGVDGEFEVICAPKRTLYSSLTADMSYFILLFLIPLIVMSVLYARMGKEILKNSAVVLFESSSTASDINEVSIPMRSHSPSDRSNVELSTFQSPNLSGCSGTSPKKLESGSDSDSDSSTSCSNEIKTTSAPSKRHGKGDKVEAAVVQSHLNPADGRSPGNSPQMSTTASINSTDYKCQSSSRVKVQVNDERNGTLIRSRHSAVRLFTMLVASFALCNFPYHLRKICQYYVPDYSVHSYFNQVCTPLSFLLMYTNCAVNPILYAFMSKTFWLSLTELVRLDYKRPKPPQTGAFLRLPPST